MRKNPENTFSRIFIEAVDEALTVLGDSAKHSVLFSLENNYDAHINDVIIAPRKFTEALEAMFGSGADYIERQILEKLYSKLELKYKEKATRNFDDYVKEARRLFSATGGGKENMMSQSEPQMFRSGTRVDRVTVMCNHRFIGRYHIW